MKAWTTLACVVVLAAMVASPVLADTANANARGDLRVASSVTAVGLSGDAQKLVVGTEDPGSYPLAPAETTWSVYDVLEQHYSELQRGSADEDAGCKNGSPVALPPPEDECQTSIVDVAVSKTGDRILIAASGSQNWLILAGAWTGKIHAITVEGDLVDVDLATDGKSGIALADDGGTVRAYRLAINATGLTAKEVTLSTVSNDMPLKVDLVGSGPYALILTEKRVELLRDATSIYSNRVASLAHGGIAQVDPYRFVAASTSGLLRLYNVAEADASYLLLNVPSSNKEISTVAISPDGEMLYIGRADSTLELHQIHADPVQLKLLTAIKLAVPAEQILFTPDGQSMFIVGGKSIGQYVPNLGMYQVWSGAMEENITAVALDDAGKRVAVAAGDRVRVFEGIFNLKIDTPDQIEVLPGKRNAIAIDLSNEGNRVERVSWQLEMEKDWITQTKSGEAYVLPGESHTIFANVDVPQATSPQTTVLKVRAASATRLIDVVVPEVRAFEWASGGDNVEVKATPGGTDSWTGELRNVGNIPAKPIVSVKSLGTGWTGTVLQSPGTLQPLETGHVRISLAPPTTARHLEAAEFDVLVGESAMRLKGIVGATFGLDVQAPESINGASGESVAIEFKVRNTGNVAENLIIRAEDVPLGWVIEFGSRSDLRITGLGPGQEARVAMVVKAPDGAAATGFLTLVAASSIHAPTSDAHQLVVHMTPGADEGGRLLPMPLYAIFIALGVALMLRTSRGKRD